MKGYDFVLDVELAQLGTIRNALLQDAYNGRFIMVEWMSLKNLYQRLGHEYNAQWCLRKMIQFSTRGEI